MCILRMGTVGAGREAHGLQHARPGLPTHRYTLGHNPGMLCRLGHRAAVAVRAVCMTHSARAARALGRLTVMLLREKWPRSANSASAPVMHSMTAPRERHAVAPWRAKYDTMWWGLRAEGGEGRGGGGRT